VRTNERVPNIPVRDVTVSADVRTGWVEQTYTPKGLTLFVYVCTGLDYYCDISNCILQYSVYILCSLTFYLYRITLIGLIIVCVAHCLWWRRRQGPTKMPDITMCNNQKYARLESATQSLQRRKYEKKLAWTAKGAFIALKFALWWMNSCNWIKLHRFLKELKWAKIRRYVVRLRSTVNIVRAASKSEYNTYDDSANLSNTYATTIE